MCIFSGEPDPPIIQEVGTSQIGMDMTLMCRSQSRTLPKDHGLPYEVWWQDTSTQQTLSTLQENSRVEISFVL